MRISFIGTGSMGGALLERCLEAGVVLKDDIFACDVNESRLGELQERLKINVGKDNKKGAEFGDVVVIAVIPKQVRGVIEEISTKISESKIVVSVAALVSTRSIENMLMKNIGVVRVMPNIPSLVGSGFNLVTFGKFVKEEKKAQIKELLSAWGEYREIDEQKMELYTIISAMGLTYFFPFIDTLISFGVENGLSEREVKEAVCSTLKGTADLIMKTSRPVNDLKDMIASQPLHEKEQELKSIFKEALYKTLNELKTISKKMTQ